MSKHTRRMIGSIRHKDDSVTAYYHPNRENIILEWVYQMPNMRALDLSEINLNPALIPELIKLLESIQAKLTMK